MEFSAQAFSDRPVLPGQRKSQKPFFPCSVFSVVGGFPVKGDVETHVPCCG